MWAILSRKNECKRFQYLHGFNTRAYSQESSSSFVACFAKRVIHDNNSSDLALSTSLNDLDFATLNIDGQSMEVEAPPNIIAVDDDDDFIHDEDGIPHDLADSDDEVLANADDDEAMIIVYSSDEED
ncbi:hypothetical protein Tco_0218103 [Tanacetum coccineum]